MIAWTNNTKPAGRTMLFGPVSGAVWSPDVMPTTSQQTLSAVGNPDKCDSKDIPRRCRPNITSLNRCELSEGRLRDGSCVAGFALLQGALEQLGVTWRICPTIII